jgi:hypothetical protein
MLLTHQPERSDYDEQEDEGVRPFAPVATSQPFCYGYDNMI